MTPQEKLHLVLRGITKEIDAGVKVPEKSSLAEQVRSIDRLKDQLGPDTSPMLLHYLEKRSYAKALDFLEGRDCSATPNCGR